VAAVDETDRRPPLSTHLDALEHVITDVVGRAISGLALLGPAVPV
jgi:hypothetical protein